jgi:hypothetical protein
MLEAALWERRARRLAALLEAERALLGRADIAGLARLAPRRERLAALVARPPARPGPDAPALLARIRAAAATNLALIGALRAGLARAAAVIAATADAEPGLYLPGGRVPAPAAAPGPRTDRRA